ASGGDLGGVPRDSPPGAIVYNADVLRAAGVKPPPATWDDTSWTFAAFLAAALRLVRRGDGPNGVSQWAWSGHEDIQQWMPWVFNNGGEFVSPDGLESRWDHPKTVEALQYLADLQYRHHVAPTPQQRQTEGPMDP